MACTSFKTVVKTFPFLVYDECELTGLDGVERDMEVGHGDLGAFGRAALQGGRGGGQRAEERASWCGANGLGTGVTQHWRALERPHLEKRVRSAMAQ